MRAGIPNDTRDPRSSGGPRYPSTPAVSHSQALRRCGFLSWLARDPIQTTAHAGIALRHHPTQCHGGRTEAGVLTMVLQRRRADEHSAVTFEEGVELRLR